jgi:hypothetical protein
MPEVCSTRRRSSDLDTNMQETRRKLAELERMEAEEAARKQAEAREFYLRKWQKFEPALERFLGFFPMIREVDADWRRDVFCGHEQFEPQVDQVVRGLYAIWLVYSRMFREEAEYLGRHLPGKLDESLDRLAKHAREGDRILRAWEQPVLSRGYSFRAPPLSPEAAARFDQLFPTAK